jgi:hypothetical protein
MYRTSDRSGWGKPRGEANDLLMMGGELAMETRAFHQACERRTGRGGVVG